MSIKKFALSVLVGIVAALGLAVPAQAAGTCKIGGAARVPAVAGPNFWLRNTNTTGYTGTPFSYQVKLDQSDITGQPSSRWYTFDRGYRHTQEFYAAMQPGDIVQIRTWCGGKRGADWKGRVHYRN